MKAKYKISCAVAALLSGYGGPAFADPAVTASNTQAAGIEEVVVTADRRDQSVRNVPMTVQAFTGQALNDLNVNTLDDLLKYTPNVTYGNNGPGQGDIFIRGLSNGFRGDQSSSTVGNFPNVAIYLDEQSMQFPARNVDIYMVDMNRIEVLEGPQGTLFGGGAEAGAIRYITNKPDLETFGGSAEASYGTTDGGGPNSSANLVLNIPIIENKLAVRLVVYDDNEGGYIDNVYSTFTRSNQDLGNYYWNIKPNPITLKCPNGYPAGAAGLCSPPNSGQVNNSSIAGKDSNPVTHDGARASLLYQVDPDWDILVAESFTNLDAQGLSVEYPVGSDFQPLGPDQVTSFAPSYDKDRMLNTAWTVNGKIWDGIKVIYTGGYTDRTIKQQMDYTNYSRTGGGMYYQCSGGGTGWGGPAYCYSPVGYWDDSVRNTHLSNELRFSSPDDWRFRFIAGGYWEKYQIDDVMNFKYKTLPACNAYNYEQYLLGNIPLCVADVRTAPGSTANDPGVRDDSTAFGEDTQRGYTQTAAFGSVDYDIIPDVLTVTAGTRWFQYQEFEVGSQYATTTGCLDVPNGDCTGGLVNINAANDKKTYTGHKSRVNVQWHVTDDIMLYYLYSEGFRPGGFNRSVAAEAPGVGGDQYEKPNSYAPDSLVNNEIGAKAALFNDNLQLNLSAYYMRWDDVQFLFFDPPELGNTTFGVNGPNYDIKGVELQAIGRVTDGLTLQGSGTYNENTQANSPCLEDNISTSPDFGHCITEAIPKGSSTLQPFPNPFGTIGSVAAFSPKYQGNLRARYDWVLWGDYNAFATAGVEYTGSMWNQPATYTPGAGVIIPNTTYLRYFQPAYTTFDASFGVAFSKWVATVYGENLGNSHASTFTSSAQFIQSEVPLRPRVIGVKLDYKF
jgi:outer membrane receptor protein involved in Fe transport